MFMVTTRRYQAPPQLRFRMREGGSGGHKGFIASFGFVVSVESSDDRIPIASTSGV